MSETVIRTGTRDDHGFVRTLGYETVGTSVSPFRPATPQALAASVDRLLGYVFNVSHTILIAEVDGMRAGYLLMIDSLPDEVSATPQMFVAYMAVDEQYRKRGIGRSLLTAAEKQAQAQGLPHISLMVTDSNSASDFYEIMGYRTERRLMCKTL